MLEVAAQTQGVGLLLAAVWQFLGVSILCDVHLCPALENLSEQLKIPTALAAASLLAFGSSAPELILATFGAVSSKVELSVPAVLVSALIAFAAIPPMVVWSVGSITLQVKEVVRDALCYAVGLVLFIAINEQAAVGILSAATLVVSYVAYLCIVYRTSLPEVRREDCEEGKTVETDSTGSTTSSQAQTTIATAPSTSAQLDAALLEKEADDEEEVGPMLQALQKPFEVAFKYTISDPENVYSAFLQSMAWLCALSYGALLCADRLSSVWGLSQSTAGVTLLAWGGQLPDAIAAVALAKRDMPDEAISQAIASQVINVTIGLGAPLLVYTWITGKPTATAHRSTFVMIAATVLLSVVAYLASMSPNWKTQEGWRLTATITKGRAVFLAACFSVLYLGIIAFGELQHHRISS